MYELTQFERDTIKSLANSFWADLRVTTYKQSVILYVSSHRKSFDYASCLGIYPDRDAVRDAVLNSPEYKDRSTYSAASGLRGMLQAHGQYHELTEYEIALECQKAIDYWLEKREMA